MSEVRDKARLLITSPSGERRISYWSDPLVIGAFDLLKGVLSDGGYTRTTIELQRLNDRCQYCTVAVWPPGALDELALATGYRPAW